MTLSPAASKSAGGKAGPAKPADVLALGAWGADSSTLAVATAGGGIYLVSRRWELSSATLATSESTCPAAQLDDVYMATCRCTPAKRLGTAFAPAGGLSPEQCALQGRSGAS